MRLRPLLISTVAAGMCLFGFWEIAEQLSRDPGLLAFDTAASQAITSLRAPWLTALMRAVTAAGGTVVVGVGMMGVVAWLLRQRKRREAYFSTAVVVVGVAVSTLAKGQFERIRPSALNALIPLPESFSFPSGHSMASLCIAAAVVFIASGSRMNLTRRLIAFVLSFLYVIAVGFSRVYLGVHYPSDVAASWLLGAAVVSLCVGLAVSTAEWFGTTPPG